MAKSKTKIHKQTEKKYRLAKETKKIRKERRKQTNKTQTKDHTATEFG